MTQSVSTAVRTRNLVAAYAHQSVMIENNTLPISASHEMHEELAGSFFQDVNLASLPLRQLAKTPLPRLASFRPGQDNGDAESMELRNHIVASECIAQTAGSRAHGGSGLSTSNRGFDEHQVRALSALAMAGLDPRGLYPWAIGPRLRLGQYRQTPIGVKSNPMAVFPYHTWRCRHTEKLHPLILACHAMVYFLLIHPFVDGNGRVSRMIVQDDLMRQGYLPPYLVDLDRGEYLTMIRSAADGNPSLLVDRVVHAQLDSLQSTVLGDTAAGALERT
ncbi:hypothetical protein SCUCBS95973_002840 [Sporothrix curviconia]|uniref:Fido domain-containing protein n=1 Tax=Sporothrix curviconia TaxID=1260050 RepID=A0ABP0BAI1_9PEZI